MSTPSDRPNRQILDVLRRDRRRRQRHARRVDAFVLADLARLRRPSSGSRCRRWRRRAARRRPSASSSRSPGRTLCARPVEGRGRCARPADASRRCAMRTASPGFSVDRARRPSSRPVRIFGPPRSWRIATSQQARRSTAARTRANVARLRLVRAVRKVQAEDVGAGGDQRVEHGVGVARGADGRDDLRVAHA